MRVWAAAALAALLSTVGVEAQPNKPFDPNMDYDEMQRQYLPGMMKEIQSGPRKGQAFIADCINTLTVVIPSSCKKNLPVLDKSSCNQLFKSRKEAEKACRGMAKGHTVDVKGNKM